MKIVKPEPWSTRDGKTFIGNRKLIEAETYKCGLNEHVFIDPHTTVLILRKGRRKRIRDKPIMHDTVNYLKKINMGKKFNQVPREFDLELTLKDYAILPIEDRRFSRRKILEERASI